MATILFIEDDQFIAEMYGRSLLRAGHTVRLAQTITQARAEVIKQSYDIILLDILLPGGSGLDLLSEIQQKQNNLKKTHVIILTNFDQDADAKAKTLKLSDQYLIKAETTPKTLLKTIATSIDN